MLCPGCGSKTRITETRLSEVGDEKWRRHTCTVCLQTFNTIEYAVEESEIPKRKWRKKTYATPTVSTRRRVKATNS